MLPVVRRVLGPEHRLPRAGIIYELCCDTLEHRHPSATRRGRGDACRRPGDNEAGARADHPMTLHIKHVLADARADMARL
jgi:hypothetical protein